MTNSTSNQPLPWGVLFFNSIIGLLFMLINFPILLSKIISTYAGNAEVESLLLDVVNSTQKIIYDLAGNNPESTFQSMISFSFIGLWLYVILLGLFSLRHGNFSLFGLGILGLLAGIVCVQIISWIALIILAIISFVFSILGFIIGILGVVIVFLLRYGIWVVAIGYGLYLLYTYREYVIKYFIWALLAIGLGYFLYKVMPLIWQWFINLIRPILDFLSKILGYLAVIVVFLSYIALVFIGILGILTTLGHLVVDQIKGAWHAGNGHKGVMLGAFSIGTALALIFLTSVANPALVNSVNYGWTESWQILDTFTGYELSTSDFAHIQLTNGFVQTMPTSVRNFVFENLINVNAPLYDTFLLITVMAISYMGILRSMPFQLGKQQEKISVTFYPDEYFAIFGGLILQIVLIFAQSLSEGGGDS